MSDKIDVTNVRNALEKTGSKWLVDSWGDQADKHLKSTAGDLEKFVREYRQRFKESPDLMGLVEVNPVKAAAFFQIDTLLASREMKIMIWRLLLGCEIKELQLKYKATKDCSLRFILSSPYGGEDESYETNDSTDLRVLRHFALTGINGKYVLQGYYAFQRTH